MSAGGLTLEEVAELLGVHYMTVYRYVRQGRLEARRVKGMWHVSEEALKRFQKERSRARASKKAGAGTGSSTDGRRTGNYDGRRTGNYDGRRTGNYVTELERCLVAADAAGAWAVLDRAIAAGADVDEVYLNILSPVLASIGEQWAKGRLDISVEHQATAIATRLVGQLSPRFLRRGRHRGVVVIGGPPGERHALTLAMLADLLRREGWDVVDLGADTPEQSFIHAVSSTSDVVAVGVSVGSDENLASAASTIAALRRTLGGSLPIVVGGPAVQDEEHARALGAEHFAAGARGFVELLDRLTERVSPGKNPDR